MDKWQQEFACRVGALRDQWARRFEAFANQALSACYAEYEALAQRCELQPGAPKGQTGVRTYRFALTEDAYVLLYFRPKGIDRIEFDYECCFPGVGRLEGVKSTCGVDRAGADWVQSCFRMALDDLVDKFAEHAGTARTEELAMA